MGVEGCLEEYPHLHTAKSIKRPELKNPEVTASAHYAESVRRVSKSGGTGNTGKEVRRLLFFLFFLFGLVTRGI